ncbi:MAG: sodium:solute symporter family protein [Adhaeribacter sp.]
MLLFFILLYLLITLLVGLWASRRVHTTADYLLAGRQLPFTMATAVVFATWFGSETLLGASAEFAEKGVLGIIEDPFGASLCLVLIGLFFAKKLYRLNLLTFGDFYRQRYNRSTEVLASLFLVVSYFGWIAAQFVALGIVLNLVTGLSLQAGILLSFGVVVLYTFMGGMWSVSVTDFLQTIMILLGLGVVTFSVMWERPWQEVIHKLPTDFFRFTPADGSGYEAWLNYFGMWITIGLGSIPQQDVFQRVMASRSEKVAVSASFAAAGLYLSVALMPLVLALYARASLGQALPGDSQLLVPALILQQSPVWIQILFFGALVSAIMSTASGAMLAPAAILSENLLRPFYPSLSEGRLLHLSRASVGVVALASLGFALQRSNIFELVSESSALSLVSLFVPLVAGLYWPRAGSRAALFSMTAGMGVWLGCLWLETSLDPMLYGLAASLGGLLAGAWLGPSAPAASPRESKRKKAWPGQP